MSAPQRTKRGPTVLVTDSREVARVPSRPNLQSRSNNRVISVDNVLQYASEIPSAQRRSAPAARNTAMSLRSSSGRYPVDPKLSGMPLVKAASAQHMPARSSKTSEKLVLLPETTAASSPPDEALNSPDEADTAPPSDADLDRRRRKSTVSDKSYAERMPKAQRTERLARVTAYCTSQSTRLRASAEFIRDQHGARTKLYDDCLYCVYQLPLLGGTDGFRIRSSPVRNNPLGKNVLDERIEANERRNYREGWRAEQFEYSVVGNEGHNRSPDEQRSPTDERNVQQLPNAPADEHQAPDGGPVQHQTQDEERRESNASSSTDISLAQAAAAASTTSELYIFSYGVVVCWNFTESQEKDLLADLTFSSTLHFSSSTSPSASRFTSSAPHSPVDTKISIPRLVKTALLIRPLPEADFETEEFHFEYNPTVEKPRIYNDMITLRTTDHMIKLAMSHAIAQSTKLSFFEARMQRTMSKAQYVPRRLALEGTLGMSRAEVVALVGKLFEGRVDVNLSSNMLDTPNFFWDSEPTLNPLYQAVRSYLEIKPRVQLMNERCKVFLDLAEILSDSIADTKMTRITWIIIVLIILSILVTCTEVFLRFGIVSTKKRSVSSAWTTNNQSPINVMQFASYGEL